MLRVSAGALYSVSFPKMGPESLQYDPAVTVLCSLLLGTCCQDSDYRLFAIKIFLHTEKWNKVRDD